VLFADYAEQWLSSRPRPLAPRTRELYDGLLVNHILPTFGPVTLGGITTAGVRGWHAGLVAGGSTSAPAKAYRLLRAILATAVEDELLARNPCVIRGAGVEHAPERPVASIADVYAIADAIEPRFRVLILTAAFSSLRQGELFGLRRRDVDLLHREMKVERQAQTLRGTVVMTPPKSRAGVRTVALPARLIPDLEHHLAAYVAADRDALVFCGAKGAPLARSNWTRKWHEALKAAGIEGLHFHDLRHTGNTLAAATGASTKELMARMGHASPRAALIYQHATRERDMAIADALDQLIGRAAPPSPSAPVRALPPAFERT
jgi:integrase